MTKPERTIHEIGQSLDELASRGLARAKELGADAMKVVTSASRSRSLVAENKRFSLANSLESQKIGLVLHKDQKKGSATTNNLSFGDLERCIGDALALASFSLPDEALNFADRALAPTAKALDFLYDEALTEVSLEELSETMQAVLARLTRDPRVAIDRYEMAVSVSRQSMLNSHGVRQSEAQTMIHWSYLGMAREGDNVTGMDYDSGFSFRRAGYREEALAAADRFVAKVVASLNPRRAPTYKGPVVLSPRAVGELLLDDLFFHASGRSVMDGKSRWAKSVGERVVSERLTVSDHPHDAKLQGATAYDEDGIPTVDRVLFDRGVLVEHLVDCYSARRLGAKPNGIAGGPFALHVAAGDETLQSLLASRKEILYVDRFSGNGDPLTGDFSGVAKASRLFIDGKDAGPVTETMIAGNVFDMANAVLGISREREIVSGGMISPNILVDGISVSGQDG